MWLLLTRQQQLAMVIEELHAEPHLELEPNVADTELYGSSLEENTGGDAGPKFELEANEAECSDDSDEGEIFWEIPFAEEVTSPADYEILDVRLWPEAGERLGLVLDEDNTVVMLREHSPAERCGGLLPGDRVLALQGAPCSRERRVAQLLRELPDAAVYVLTIHRALGEATRAGTRTRAEIAEHGPLMTQSELLEAKEREADLKHELRKQGVDVPLSTVDEAAAESKRAGGVDGLDPATRRQLNAMWERQARDKLPRRLSAADMLREEGNEKFSCGEYDKALEEYTFALELFKYEMANLCRDQQAAQLGDEKRGLGSEDLPAIQQVRVPCLLNSAACLLKMGDNESLLRAVDCCAEVVRAAPPAGQRAKANFRAAQAHKALGNPREAWEALQTAQQLNPSSREVRELQLAVSRDLKALKQAEREHREGMMSTEMNHSQIFKQQRAEFATRLKMARALLPHPPGASDGARAQFRRDEALLERVASKGWASLGDEDQLSFGALWSAAQPRLSTTAVRDGRDAGVYPPRDEEKIFGVNLPHALMSKPFPPTLSWLIPAQRQRARGLALTIWQRGAEDLDDEERRLCEGLALLALSDRACRWHTKPLGAGGAQLLLSPARQAPPPAAAPVRMPRGVDVPMRASGTGGATCQLRARRRAPGPALTPHAARAYPLAARTFGRFVPRASLSWTLSWARRCHERVSRR